MIRIWMASRRKLLLSISMLTGVGVVAAYFQKYFSPKVTEEHMKTFKLDFQWPVQEPFLFCVHHHDLYPQGTDSFGPDKKYLSGRDLGQDFTEKDGFRMYHGEDVPGFPVHPHRGFETITIVRKGFIDHADSLGAAGRYGNGDVQWMTAGEGVQHSEMFPLLQKNSANTVELFQIWLNLPKKNKMVKPHFTMFWSEQIPEVKIDNATVSVIAGEFSGTKALRPPPDSWASDVSNEVTILLVKLTGGLVQVPASKNVANRTLYFFEGSKLEINRQNVLSKTGVTLNSQNELELRGSGEVLILQAKPMNEPVVQHGPFVMNSKEEIAQAFEDYRRTRFGGWPWKREDMVHGSVIERFAKYPDGRVEKPKV